MSTGATGDELPIFWRAQKKRWVLPYKASDGKWSQKLIPAEFTKSMKKAARQWAADWLAANPTREYVPVRKLEGIALRAAHERFLELAAKNDEIAPSTVEGYRTDFRSHILNDAGLERDEQISGRGVAALGSDFALLKAWYLAARRRCTSASRARALFSTMKVFFDEAIVQRWYRGQNPFRMREMMRLRPELPTKREQPPVVLPLAHAQALISSEDVEVPSRVRYAVAFTAGLRDGEISGLTWSNVALDGVEVPVFEIDHARRRVRRKDEDRGPLKSRTSNRTLPMHPAAADALRWWRDAPDGFAFHVGRAPRPTDPIFPSLRYSNGTATFARPASAKKIRAFLRKLALPTAGAKGRSVTMHAARRSFLSWLERAGAPDQDRKLLAGHGITDVTHRHYTAEDAERLRELAASVALVALRWDVPGAPTSSRKGGPPPPSRPLARAGGLVGVRVEVDGRTVARTDVEAGDSLGDVEARLRASVGRHGGLR